MMMKKYGILLDLDGTLWDSSRSVAEAWTQKLEQLGIDQKITQKEIQDVMGLPMDEIAQILFKEQPPQDRMPLMEACAAYENEYITRHGGKLYPGLKETLRKLHDEYFVAIVSNCQKGYIEAFISYFNLYSLIDDFESYGRTGMYKDKNIRRVINRNHLQKALYVGDIEKDRQAAQGACIPFVFASYGMGHVRDGYRIDSLYELPDRVQEVFAREGSC